MDLQHSMWAVQLIVGVVGVAGLFVGIGKLWASLSFSTKKVAALHLRFDNFEKEYRLENRSLRDEIIKIRTVLNITTLRFPRQLEPLPTVSGQDILKEDE